MKGQNIMDWRTDKITAEELERKMKEYAEVMMKMAQNTAPKAPSSEVSSESIAKVEEAVEEVTEKAEEIVTEISEETVEAKDDITEETESAEEVFTDIDEEPEIITEDDEHADDELSEANFGVFTAEEILNGDYNGEGFEKANEIIEEITKKKEIMKGLAENRTPEDDCDCTGEIPEIADAEDIFGEDVICPKCGKRKTSGRRG